MGRRYRRACDSAAGSDIGGIRTAIESPHCALELGARQVARRWRVFVNDDRRVIALDPLASGTKASIQLVRMAKGCAVAKRQDPQSPRFQGLLELSHVRSVESQDVERE